MKKILLGIIGILFLLSSYAQIYIVDQKDSLEIQKKVKEFSINDSRIDSCLQMINRLKLDKEYVIENFEIQNNTILYVSTILAILLTIVIVYFGWRAQMVENEYERAKKDRERIKDQFDNFFIELNAKKKELNETSNQINQIKVDIESQKENLNKIIEGFILTYTKEYIESNKEIIFKSTENENKVEEVITSDQIAQLTEQIELLEKLQSDSNPEIEYRKIDFYFKAKKYNKVISLLEDLLKKDDFKKAYYFHYAYALSEIDDKEKSIKFYNEYLKIQPKSTAALNNLGLVYKSQNDMEKAKVNFAKALELKTEFLYFKNLIKCYSNTEERLILSKKYFDKFEMLDEKSLEKRQFIFEYIKLLEDNLFIDELVEFHKNEYQKSDNAGTFLNMLETSILAREEMAIKELIEKADSYKLNSAYKLIFYLLISLSKCIKNEDCNQELNNIEIISQDKSAFTSNWRFNLLDVILQKLPQSDAKTHIEGIVKILKEHRLKTFSVAFD